MVGGTGIEPVTSSMSRKHSTAELTAPLGMCEFGGLFIDLMVFWQVSRAPQYAGGGGNRCPHRPVIASSSAHSCSRPPSPYNPSHDVPASDLLSTVTPSGGAAGNLLAGGTPEAAPAGVPPIAVMSQRVWLRRWSWLRPTSGAYYPSDFIAASSLGLATLRRSEDCYVDELFADAPGLGLPLLRALYPRAYCDVNREPYELTPAIRN